MGHPQLQVVLRHAGALAGRRPEPGTDAELYARFTRDRDESAFAELVRRHGPMVWGACRNMLPHDADAEDAFQATFLALVRANGSIRDADRLAGWLHGVAVRVALKARRSSAHRRRREQAAAEGEATAPIPDTAWDELLTAVHEEVQQLPAALRSAFILCELEGVRQPEAAVRLGCTPGTLTTRLTRARQRLLERLSRRGLTPAVASGAIAAGTATGSAAAPGLLVASVCELIQPMTSVSPNVLYLAQGVIEMNVRTKWLAAGLLAAVGFAMTAGTALISDASAQRPGPDRQPPGRDRDRGGQPPAARGGFGGMMAGPAIRGWEYKVVNISLRQGSPAEAQLNKLGEDGWELAMGTDSGTLVFKRQKLNLPARRGAGSGGGDADSGGGAGGSGLGAGAGLFGGAGAGGPGAGFDAGAPGAGPGGPSGGGRRPAGPPPGGYSPPGGVLPGGAGGVGMPPGLPGVSRSPDTQVIQLRNASASDLAVILKEVFARTPGISIVPDQRTNSLILSGDAGAFKSMQVLIERLDVEDGRTRKQ